MRKILGRERKTNFIVLKMNTKERESLRGRKGGKGRGSQKSPFTLTHAYSFGLCGIGGCLKREREREKEKVIVRVFFCLC